MTKQAQTQFKNAVREGMNDALSKMTPEQLKRVFFCPDSELSDFEKSEMEKARFND
jgi:hypothetical protein